MGFVNIFRGRPEEGRAVPKVSKQFVSPETQPEQDKTLYFQHWCDSHRRHQKKALKAMEGQSLGQICLPTGTGKTRVQVSAHVQDMLQLQKEGRHGIFTISAHRLALCTQLLEDLIHTAVNTGIPFDILFVGSSRFDEDRVHAKFRHLGFNSYVSDAVSTTQPNEIRMAAGRAKRHGRHVLCVSTYHSFDRLKSLDHIDLCTYDEAHVTVGEDFREHIELLRPKISRNFFFTATRRVQGLQDGMNNESLFGKVLYETSPRAMIEAGEIVPPKLHIIQTVGEGDYENHTMLVKTVLMGFEQHKFLVKQGSFDPDVIGAKLLITTTGNLEMFELHDDMQFKQYCQENNVQVFAYSSERGCFHNFQPVSRDRAMRSMREMPDEQDAIMLHIDILTEGIDLPAITGVMPFRELNTLKLLQTIGRSARLMREDRRRLYSGEIAPRFWDSYVKPCCWLILPENFRSLGDASAMKNTLRTIVNAYSVPTEEYHAIDKYLAEEDEEKRITDIDQATRRDRETDLTHLVEELMQEQFGFLSVTKRPFQLVQNLFRK